MPEGRHKFGWALNMGIDEKGIGFRLKHEWITGHSLAYDTTNLFHGRRCRG